ncbi:MAG TPA: hypothetical protein VFJ16_18965 [Longimicrobium sp.]|nr:hypothetical protein [Longimicrobium sp.]
MPPLRLLRAGLTGLVLATLAAACQDAGRVTAPPTALPGAPRHHEVLDITTPLSQTQVEQAYLIVCKDVPAGSPQTTFLIKTDYMAGPLSTGGPEGNITSRLTVSGSDGSCHRIFRADDDPNFWVFEPADSIPAGWHLAGATVYVKDSAGVVTQREITPQQLVNIRPLMNSFIAPPVCWIDVKVGCMVVVHNAPDAGGSLTATKTAAGTYDRTLTWTLAKSVTPSTLAGTAGQTAGTSTWTVTATRSESLGNYRVAGTISVGNPGTVPVTFAVTDQLDDGTTAAVTCPSNTVGAGGTVTCTYTALPAGGGATLNTATISVVSPAGVQGTTATAPVTFTPNVAGDSAVTLADPRFGSTQVISASKTVTFPESFPCPSDATLYNANGIFTRTATNTATLTGASTTLSRSASVQITCTRVMWAGETAVGAGTRYPNTANWFMYTPYTTSKVDLIAGQKYDAGDVYMSRSGSTTTIRIVLQNGFTWAEVAENLKIQPFDSAPTGFVTPGSFLYKFTTLSQLAKAPGTTVTYNASTNTVVVTMPGTSARFYGIHGDVRRPL